MQIADRAVLLKIREASSRKGLLGLISYYEVVLATVVLIAILTVFFGRSLLPGMVMSAADGTFSTPFFGEAKPAGFTEPSNSLLFDQVYQFTPWRYYAWKSLNDGFFPLWNPYSSSGTPFVATMQSAVFYPINLLLTFLPFESTFVWSAFLRLWIAGISTYLLMRYYKIGRVASLISAVSFMLCGYLVVWLGHPHTNVAIWLPALVLLAELFLRTTRRSKLLFIMGLVGLVVGIQFTGGHIETSVDILFAVGLYYIFRWVVIVLPRDRTLVFKLKYIIVIPLVLFVWGFAVAAVQLAPFIEWLSVGSEFKNRGGFSTGFQFIDPTVWRHLLELPVILFPNLYNNPTWNDFPYWSFLPLEGNFNENILYLGTLPLLFAILAIFVRWKDEPLVKIWSLIALISFGRAFHLPVFDWLNHLPILSLENPDRLRLALSFCLCVLAGFGAEALWNSRLPGQNVVIRKLWVWGNLSVLLIGLIILIMGNTALPALATKVRILGRERVDTELSKRDAPPQFPLEHYYAEVDQMVDGLIAAFRFNNIAMYTPMAWVLVGLVSLLLYWKYGVVNVDLIKILLLVLVTIDLINFGRNYNPALPIEQFYPATTTARQIRKDETLFRVTAVRQDLIPDAHMLLGFQDVRGLDFPTDWYNQYMNLIPERIPWLTYGMIFSSVDSPMLDILNIKYVMSAKADILEQDKDIKIITQNEGIYVGEVMNVSPRAFMVYKAIQVQNDEQVIDVLKNESRSLFDQVLLSDAEDAPQLANTSILVKDISHNVQILDYTGEQSTWRVSTEENGYLFLSETYYPGWNAYLDDHPTELYRADLAFRAVYVPSGEHVISFRYEPMWIRIGAIISIISLAITFLVLIVTNKAAFRPDKINT
jgi:hypothetical protein